MMFFSSSKGRCLLLASSSAAVAERARKEAPATSCAADKHKLRLVMGTSISDRELDCTQQVTPVLW